MIACINDRLLNMDTWRELAQLRGAEMNGVTRTVNEWDNRVGVAVGNSVLRTVVEDIESHLDPNDPVSVEIAHLALDLYLEAIGL